MIRKIEDLDFEDEFRRLSALLTASAELHGADPDENELSFELLDKALFRVREIDQAFRDEGGRKNA
ncbi:hypothetical protein IAE49_13870 [Kosakonia sp. S58]|uniref:hypothetical protein n=1 Tax=Kosakonia TaxID=1330547 RepID=UPI001906A0FB|nr:MULTISPECIES: hypothetical protein [Kosakonia]MBK0015785.1 hypothetical protein [Kosakonia sp. S42]MBK0080350.1 hypothetical protein [Kosakonia sp. S57]MBK0087326.1 hypothetical protein [Kosakonia sp. S58]UGS46650.1 hypothetical protein JMT66_02840 [Kosakonia cowanii]